MVNNDTNETSDIFVYYRDSGEFRRVSIGPDDREANGLSYGAAISSDGYHVAYASYATNLIQNDENGFDDVFVTTLSDANGPGIGQAVLMSFARVAVDTNGTLAGAQIENRISVDHLVSKSAIEYHQLIAIIGDGDQDLEIDESGYNLSDFGYGGRVSTLISENTVADPVLLTAWGRINNNSDGDLTKAVRFGSDAGFGLDNGPDGEGMARWLNNGDALTFQVNPTVRLSAPSLQTISFVVNVRDDATPGTRVKVVLDFDGDLLHDTNGPAKQGGFVTDGLLTLSKVADGVTVTVNFVSRTIAVDGVPWSVDTGFWQAFEAAGGDRITIGAAASDGAGFAVKDLKLQAVLD